MPSPSQHLDSAYYYPPELFELLVEAIPALCKSKQPVRDFFKGAVGRLHTASSRNRPPEYAANFKPELLAGRGRAVSVHVVPMCRSLRPSAYERLRTAIR